MFIEPIQPMQGIEGVQGLGSTTAAPKTSGLDVFKGIFENAVQDVIESDTAVAADVQALATGETDDLHTLGIDQTKAQLSISLLVQMRNRFLDAYNELMRINM